VGYYSELKWNKLLIHPNTKMVIGFSETPILKN
jgi:hypothetical protein